MKKVGLHGIFRAQAGFGMLAMMAGVAIFIGVAVAGVAMVGNSASRINNGVSGAQAVIAQATALVRAYETAVNKGGFQASTVAFTADSLYSPSLTGLSEPGPVPHAMHPSRRDWRWQIGRKFRLPGFGPRFSGSNTDGAEVAFYLPGVTREVCSEVNRAMSGSFSLRASEAAVSVAPPQILSAAYMSEILGDSNYHPPDSKSSLYRVSTNIKPVYLAYANPSISSGVNVFPRVGCYQLTASGHSDFYFVYAVAEAN